MIKVKAQLYFCLSFLLLISCDSGRTDDFYAPVYDKFPEIEVDHIYIQENDVINIDRVGFELIQSPEDAEYDAGVGHWPVIMGDSMVIVDQSQTSIKTIDIESGELLNRVEFRGQGPGEYQRIDYFLATEAYFLIVDKSATKLIQYSRQWKHIDDHILDGMNTMSLFNGYSYQDPIFYYPAGVDDDFLIYALNLESKQPNPEAFHSRIISLGKNPMGYNDVWIDSSPNGDKIVSHPAMPMLFMYDGDNNLNQIIRLHFPGMEQIERSQSGSENDSRSGVDGSTDQTLVNPPPVDLDTNKRVSMSYFIADVYYAEDFIFVKYNNVKTGAQNNFVTILKRNGRQWTHHGSYRFYDETESLFNVFYMTWSEPWLYLASQFEENIIKVDVESLPQVE